MHLSICPFNLKKVRFFLLAWGWQVVVVYGGRAKGAEPLLLTGSTVLIRLLDLYRIICGRKQAFPRPFSPQHKPAEPPASFLCDFFFFIRLFYFSNTAKLCKLNLPQKTKVITMALQSNRSSA